MAERGVEECGRVGVDFMVVWVFVVLGSLFSVVMGATFWFTLVASVRVGAWRCRKSAGLRAVGGGLASVGGVSNGGRVRC